MHAWIEVSWLASHGSPFDDDAAPDLEPRKRQHWACKPRVRGRTISIWRLPKRARARSFGKILTSRCIALARVLSACREKMQSVRADVRPTNTICISTFRCVGAIKLNFPHLEVWDLPGAARSTSPDRGGVTLKGAGGIMNLIRVNAFRQLGKPKGLRAIKALSEMAALDGLRLNEQAEPPRRAASTCSLTPTQCDRRALRSRSASGRRRVVAQHIAWRARRSWSVRCLRRTRASAGRVAGIARDVR